MVTCGYPLPTSYISNCWCTLSSLCILHRLLIKACPLVLHSPFHILQVNKSFLLSQAYTVGIPVGVGFLAYRAISTHTYMHLTISAAQLEGTPYCDTCSVTYLNLKVTYICLFSLLLTFPLVLLALPKYL